jgi:hypothetical protein
MEGKIYAFVLLGGDVASITIEGVAEGDALSGTQMPIKGIHPDLFYKPHP